MVIFALLADVKLCFFLPSTVQPQLCEAPRTSFPKVHQQTRNVNQAWTKFLLAISFRFRYRNTTKRKEIYSNQNDSQFFGQQLLTFD